MKNKFFNEDCFITMNNMSLKKINPNIILTSPPYNTGKSVKGCNQKSVKNFDARYDIYLENKTDEEYLSWIHKLFNKFDEILAENGVILFNMSYSSGNKNNGYKSMDLMWRVVAMICEKTSFTVADRIIWKKKTAMPNNRSHNKLTRIVEDIFVICRKKEYMTFQANKKVLSISNGKERNGQKSYENIYNFVEAKNNDGACSLNKATYSSELCLKLLNIYAKENDVVYDPFMGTGTTAVACVKKHCSFIGSELSENQVKFSEDRINKILGDSFKEVKIKKAKQNKEKIDEDFLIQSELF